MAEIAFLKPLLFDLEVKQGRYDAALVRLETLSAKSARKDPWLARRGDILLKAGRKTDAAASYESALACIENLPIGRRNAPLTVELQTRVRTALNELKSQEQK